MKNIKIQVKKVQAWEGGPYVLGFFGTITEDVKQIFKEVTKLTESKNTKEHMGKFYLNNSQKFWYVRDRLAADMAMDKINKKFGKNSAKLFWHSGV